MADDFVLATGKTHTVREFVDLAFNEVGIKISWKGNNEQEICLDEDSGKTLVSVDPSYYRPTEVDLLLGDSSKAKNLLQWEAKATLKDLVSTMVKSDLEKVKKRGY